MLPLLLALAVLQGPTQRVVASPEDTVRVRAALASADRALRTLESIPYELASRLALAHAAWQQNDAAWSLAIHADTAVSAANNRSFIVTMRLAGEVHRRGDSAAVRRALAGVPQVRDEVLAGLPNSMGISNDTILAYWAAQVEAPRPKARLWARRADALAARGDSAAARDLLRGAIALMASDTSHWRLYFTQEWLYRLRALAADVTVSDLIDAAAGSRPVRDRPYVAIEVAERLMRAGDHEGAGPILDSLVATLPDSTSREALRMRAMRRQARGTAADSAQARLLHARWEAAEDSMWAAADRPTMRGIRLINAVRGGEIARARDAIASAAAASDMATIAQAAHSLEYAYRTARYTSGGADSVYTWMRTVADLMWQAALTFDGPSVDTMRVAVVRLHALADADTALERARTIADATMRERAIGYALRRIAAYDAEGADEMAAILQDSIARSMVYEELTRRAVAGGWLRDAARLAQQTPRGPARAAALHAAASAEMEAGRVATARELLLLLLQDLDPELSCNDCQRDAPYQIRPPDPGMVVKLALQAGLEEQLDRWASGRDTPRARAAAWIAVAEGVAAARRRWVR